jgi:putative endonuclease
LPRWGEQRLLACFILRSPHSGRLEETRYRGAPYLYILRGADGSYYVGTTTAGLERRLAEHQAGDFDGYTVLRRPIELVFHQHFDRLDDAAAPNGKSKAGASTRRRLWSDDCPKNCRYRDA